MKTNPAPEWERRLLIRTQIRLIALLFGAFLVFELVVVSATTVAVRLELIGDAKAAIQHQWDNSLSDVLTQLQRWQTHPDRPVTIDQESDTIADWVVAPNGKLLVQSPFLDSRDGTVAIGAAVRQMGRHLPPALTWHIVPIHSHMVLIGTNPVFSDGRLLGAMIGVYSMQSSFESIQILTRMNVFVGLDSLVVILVLTVLLSTGWLRPIRQLMQRQRDFVNDAAHQFRTPITLLRGNLELAAGETDPQDVQESIVASLEETDYLSRLVSELSTLARLESGAAPLNRTQVNLAAVMLRVVEHFGRMAAKKAVRLDHNIPQDQPLEVIGDRTRLRQLLLLLLENALKYTEAGGTIRLSLRSAHQGVEIEVADTGIGIAKSDLAHVFDRFYRSPRARRTAPGTGIGLAVVASIVEMHRGHIQVQSELGQGTTFTVHIPRSPHFWVSRSRIH